MFFLELLTSYAIHKCLLALCIMMHGFLENISGMTHLCFLLKILEADKPMLPVAQPKIPHGDMGANVFGRVAAGGQMLLSPMQIILFLSLYSFFCIASSSMTHELVLKRSEIG